MTVAERTKRCPRCSLVKPWSMYGVRKRWPDGSVRNVKGWCKACWVEYREELRRKYPEREREYNRRRLARIYADPEKLAVLRECQRAYMRRRYGYSPRVTKVPTMRGRRIPAEPFRAWLVEHPEAQAHVPERTLRAILSGERRYVYESTVDAVLCAEGSTMLREVYAA